MDYGEILRREDEAKEELRGMLKRKELTRGEHDTRMFLVQQKFGPLRERAFHQLNMERRRLR